MVSRRDVKDWLVAQIKNLKPSFLGKTAHFNFISAHCQSRLSPRPCQARKESRG